MRNPNPAPPCDTALKAIRKSRNLSARDVAVRASAILGVKPPRTGEWITNIERRGTTDHFILSALAQVYGLSVEEVAAAARPLAKQFALNS